LSYCARVVSFGVAQHLLGEGFGGLARAFRFGTKCAWALDCLLYPASPTLPSHAYYISG